MEIIVGKYSGFCNGAKTAVRKACELLNGDVFYSVGDIIHNEVVVNNLKQKGLIVVDSINDIPNGSKVIVRAHGESIDFYQEAKKRQFELSDLTCGRVGLVHQKILSRKNDFIIIIGKKTHPETIAHNSYAKDSVIVEDVSDVAYTYQKFLDSGKESVYILAQTTFSRDLFEKLVSEIKKVFVGVDILVDKTICDATKIRQEEAMEIARRVDKMIVIGGKNSSNTKELYVVTKKLCNETYLIQTKEDIEKEWFNEDDVVGITAGASTPPEVINDVVHFLESIYKRKK